MPHLPRSHSQVWHETNQNWHRTTQNTYLKLFEILNTLNRDCQAFISKYRLLTLIICIVGVSSSFYRNFQTSFRLSEGLRDVCVFIDMRDFKRLKSVNNWFSQLVGELLFWTAPGFSDHVTIPLEKAKDLLFDWLHCLTNFHQLGIFKVSTHQAVFLWLYYKASLQKARTLNERINRLVIWMLKCGTNGADFVCLHAC